MKTVRTDFGVVPVEDDSYDDLKEDGPLYKDLLQQVERIWPFYPNISAVSVHINRIGLWNNGEERKFIRIQFTGDFAAPTEHKPC